MGFFVPGNFKLAGSCPLTAVVVCLCSVLTHSGTNVYPGNAPICC